MIKICTAIHLLSGNDYTAGITIIITHIDPKYQQIHESKTQGACLIYMQDIKMLYTLEVATNGVHSSEWIVFFLSWFRSKQAGRGEKT